MKELMIQTGQVFFKNSKTPTLKGFSVKNWLFRQLKEFHLNPWDDCCGTYVPPTTPIPLAEVVYFNSNITIDDRANGNIYVYDGVQDPVYIDIPTTAEDPTILIGTSFKLINTTFSVMSIISIGNILSTGTITPTNLSEQYGEYTCTKLNDTDWIITQG